MKKVAAAIIIIIIILFILFNYLKSPQEPPELTITIGDKEIEYVVAKNKWHNAVYDREDTFKSILKEGNEEELPYVDIGKTAVISFKDSPPKEFVIYDILIDKNGNQIYSNMKEISIPIEKKSGSYSFEIKKNMASGLSSTYVENKKDIRGFRMIATWGKDECEYAFVIRTDAY